MVVVAVLAVGGVVVGLMIGGGDGSRGQAAGRPAQTGSTHDAVDAAGPTVRASATPPTADHLPARPGARPCVSIRVLASLEDADLLTALAAAYHGNARDVAGHCVTVKVSAMGSGQAAAEAEHGFAGQPAAGRPTIWWPDSSDWLAIGHASSSVVPAQGVSVAWTPVVLAAPAAQAAALGWPRHPPTWGDYLSLTSSPDTVWSARGHPSWGTFGVGKTDPQQATAGLDTMLAAYRASSGSATLTTSIVDSGAVQARVHAAERATVHYGSSEANFLVHVREAAETGVAGNLLSVITVQEKSVYDYNRGRIPMTGMSAMNMMMPSGRPKTPLVPIYPADGTYVADTPAAILAGSWISAEQRAAAADLIRFAQTSQGQAVVRAAGYRDLRGDTEPGIAAIGHYRSGPVTTLSMPPASVLTAVQNSFPTIRKPGRVLLAIDVSGSMSDKLPDGHTKIQDAQSAALHALTYFTDADQVGLAAFSNRPDQKAVTPGILVPPRPLATNRARLTAAIKALTPIGQTPLYSAVGSFVSTMAAGWQPDDINAIVLLTDGHNDTDAPGTRVSLSRSISTTSSTRPVRVFTLAYGTHADVATLQQISELTGAHYYDATNPATIGDVLSDLVTNF